MRGVARPDLAERKMPRPCAVCGMVFTPSLSSRRGLYCGVMCRQKGISVSTAGMRGDIFRRTGSRNLYVKSHGRHEHRIVAEKKIGRGLKKGEIVNHLNGDKWDNRPSNLKIMTQSEHARGHTTERWKLLRLKNNSSSR